MTEYSDGNMPEEYRRRRKQFVEVIAAHGLDGSVRPQTIVLADGRKFDIEKHHDPRPAKDAGRPALAYPVWTKGEMTYLFEAGGRWWVLMKQ